MLPLKQTKTKLIAWSISTLIFLAMYIVCIMLISSTNRTLAIIDNELDSEIQKENALHNLDTFIKETENDRALIDSYSIDRDGVVSFINSLETYARDLGVEPEIIAVGIKQFSQANDFFETLELQMTVQGDWNGVYSFTRLMDTLPQNTLIKRVNLTKKVVDKESGEVVWEAVFTLDTLKKK